MKTWTRFALGAAAVALAIAAGTAAYAMRGGEDEHPASVTTQDSRDGGAEGDQGLGISAVCAPGHPDCVDTVVDVPYDDFGETTAKCAADAVDCVEPSCASDGCPAYSPVYECVDIITDPATDPPTQECNLVDREPIGGPQPLPPVEIIEPAPDEVVDPVPPETSAGAAGGIAADCPPPLPVCEDPSISACVPPDCVVSSDGSVSCPDPAPIDCAPVEPATGDDVTTLPCIVKPCEPGPAVDCAIIDPCVPGPATDCGVIDCTIVEPVEPNVDPAVDTPAVDPSLCLPGAGVEPGSSGGAEGGSPGASESGPVE